MKQRQSKSKKLNKPVVKVKQRTYQPSKAELEEKIKITTTPERLAKLYLLNFRSEMVVVEK